MTMAISPIKCFSMFSSAAAGVMNTVLVFFSYIGEEKMDPDKSVVFAL